jgi:hypothetical protein
VTEVCPAVERVVSQCLATLDEGFLREIVRDYVPCATLQQRIGDELMAEHGLTEDQAEVIAGMSDEVIRELKRRLHLVN